MLYNLSISNDLTKMVTFPTQIHDCDSHSPALLYLILSSMLVFVLQWLAFPPLENSDHAVVSVSIDFPSNLKWDAPFHRIACDYSCADWDSLHDHLRDA